MPEYFVHVFQKIPLDQLWTLSRRRAAAVKISEKSWVRRSWEHNTPRFVLKVMEDDWFCKCNCSKLCWYLFLGQTHQKIFSAKVVSTALCWPAVLLGRHWHLLSVGEGLFLNRMSLLLMVHIRWKTPPKIIFGNAFRYLMTNCVTAVHLPDQVLRHEHMSISKQVFGACVGSSPPLMRMW